MGHFENNLPHVQNNYDSHNSNKKNTNSQLLWAVSQTHRCAILSQCPSIIIIIIIVPLRWLRHPLNLTDTNKSWWQVALYINTCIRIQSYTTNRLSCRTAITRPTRCHAGQQQHNVISSWALTWCSDPTNFHDWSPTYTRVLRSPCDQLEQTKVGITRAHRHFVGTDHLASRMYRQMSAHVNPTGRAVRSTKMAIHMAGRVYSIVQIINTAKLTYIVVYSLSYTD